MKIDSKRYVPRLVYVYCELFIFHVNRSVVGGRITTNTPCFGWLGQKEPAELEPRRKVFDSDIIHFLLRDDCKNEMNVSRLKLAQQYVRYLYPFGIRLLVGRNYQTST